MTPRLLLAGATLLALVAGCATTTERQMTSRNVNLEERAISFTNLNITVPKSADIDDLIATSDKYLAYIEFKKRYGKSGEDIVTYLKAGEFEEADQMVKNLAYRLEHDKSPMAQQYLPQVMNFSYVIHEIYDIETTSTWTEIDPEGAGVMALASPILVPASAVMIPLEAAAAPINAATGQETFVITKDMWKLGTREKKKTEITGQEHKYIRVTPFYDRTEVITQRK